VDLEFSDEQAELRTSVRAFLERECPPSRVRSVVETGEPAADLWAAMVGLDWPALNVPEDCGGMGLGFAEVAVVAEELGTAIAPVPYLPTATQFVPAVAEAAGAEQRRRLLGPVAAGERTGALAVADHPSRWTVAGVTATAERAAGGWALHGEKQAVMVTPATAGSTDVVVAARVAGAPGDPAGVGLFVVPAPTLSLRPVRTLDASRPLAAAGLDGVVVPDDRVLGDPGGEAVAAALARALEMAAVALALEAVGTCQALFDLTLQHAKDRHQFGVPIGSFQAVKHRMADGYIALERARALCYFAVAAIAEGDPRRALAAAMAKAGADDCQRLVCQDSIQTFGGIGFTWEADVHLYVKRAQSSGALFGSAAEHRLAVARLLGVGAGAPA
jgi:alkylation response protein AidB-like acyl-CoA dehydrogenase